MVRRRRRVGGKRRKVRRRAQRGRGLRRYVPKQRGHGIGGIAAAAAALSLLPLLLSK